MWQRILIVIRLFFTSYEYAVISTWRLSTWSQFSKPVQLLCIYHGKIPDLSLILVVLTIVYMMPITKSLLLALTSPHEAQSCILREQLLNLPTRTSLKYLLFDIYKTELLVFPSSVLPPSFPVRMGSLLPCQNGLTCHLSHPSQKLESSVTLPLTFHIQMISTFS